MWSISIVRCIFCPNYCFCSTVPAVVARSFLLVLLVTSRHSGYSLPSVRLLKLQSKRGKQIPPWLDAQPPCLQYAVSLSFFMPSTSGIDCLQYELRPWSWWLGPSLGPQELLSWNLTVSVPSLQVINILWWKRSQWGRPDPGTSWQLPWKEHICPMRLSLLYCQYSWDFALSGCSTNAATGQRCKTQAVISLYALKTFSYKRMLNSLGQITLQTMKWFFPTWRKSYL